MTYIAKDIKINELHNADWNANRVPPEVLGKVRHSIKEFGVVENLVVRAHPSGTGYEVLSGNHRLAIFRELGMETAPAVVVDVDDARARVLAQTLNRTRGQDDPEAYARLLDDVLKDMSVAEVVAFLPETAESIQRALSQIEVDDLLREDDESDIEFPDDAESVLGEVYELGPHRLVCGDSTRADVLDLLMQGEKAQLVVTDPPYGVDYTGGHGKKKRERILGDEDASLYAEALVMAHAYTDDKAPLYVWFAGNQGEDVYRAVREAHYDVAALVFWHKTKAHYGAFMAQYMQKHEPLLYCRKRGSGARWTGPTNEVTVWDADQPSRNEWHPTQKPIEVIERCIRNSSERGHIVLDLFGGSGTTLIAADNLGRAARIVELDPRYCDVIRRRYENAKGNA